MAVLQWLKRVDAVDAGQHNATITFSYNGDVFVLLQTSRDGASTSVSTTRQRDGSHLSQLTVSRVTASDAGLYVCVVTGKYGLRSYRAAALDVYTATGQTSFYLMKLMKLFVRI